METIKSKWTPKTRFVVALLAALGGSAAGILITAVAWVSVWPFFEAYPPAAEVARAQLMAMGGVALVWGPCWWFATMARRWWQRTLLAVPMVIVFGLLVAVYIT